MGFAIPLISRVPNRIPIMLNSDIYRETYGIRPFTVLDGLPPVYRLKGLFGSTLLTTSPYLTDTPFAGFDNRKLMEYAEACRELCERENADYLLIKTRQPGFAEILRPGYKNSEAFVTTILDLRGGEEPVWKERVEAKTRNQVRKGYKSEPVTRFGKHELLNDFFRVIAITQTRLGTPVHSVRYFSNIIGHHPEAHLAVVYISDRPVSAALLLVRDAVLYHPYAGTLDEVKPESVNNVLYWEIIKFGMGKGCGAFDMGRSFKGSGNARFKNSWGGEEIQLYYCYYLNKRAGIPDYGSATMKLLTRLWSHLPVDFAKALGPRLIRSVP